MAVKVQRPYVLETVTVDLFIIRNLGVLLRNFAPGITERADIVALLDEWAARFFEELVSWQRCCGVDTVGSWGMDARRWLCWRATAACCTAAGSAVSRYSSRCCCWLPAELILGAGAQQLAGDRSAPTHRVVAVVVVNLPHPRQAQDYVREGKNATRFAEQMREDLPQARQPRLKAFGGMQSGCPRTLPSSETTVLGGAHDKRLGPAPTWR